MAERSTELAESSSTPKRLEVGMGGALRSACVFFSCCLLARYEFRRALMSERRDSPDGASPVEREVDVWLEFLEWEGEEADWREDMDIDFTILLAFFAISSSIFLFSLLRPSRTRSAER